MFLFVEQKRIFQEPVYRTKKQFFKSIFFLLFWVQNTI